MTSLIIGAISLSTVFLFGCVGEILTEKSGNLNLGIPGIMSLGALGGAVGIHMFYSIFSNPSGLGFLLIIISIIMAFIFAALGGLIYAVITITFQANQNVTGLVLTTFGVGITKFFATKMSGPVANIDGLTYEVMFRNASVTIKSLFKGYEKLGFFGEVFLSYGILVYLAIILAVLASLFLSKTRTGLFLRAVGESPATADAAGINVEKYKYLATCIGSMIAGLGGLYYVMDYASGVWSNDAFGDRGWLAIALVIFTIWRPNVSVLSSILFGGLFIIHNYIPGLGMGTQELFKMAPYAVTIIVLVIISMLQKREFQPPASLGLSYFREER